MNGYTPGPWRAIERDVSRIHTGIFQDGFADGYWEILAPHGAQRRLPIAIIDRHADHDTLTRVKAKFDANLIAAAPELFETLLATVGILDASTKMTRFERGLIVGTLKAARSAISQATGEPQCSKA